METKHTKGEWRVNESGSCIVTNSEHTTASNNSKESKDYYGGVLICESALNQYDAKLIAAAPENTKCNIDSMNLLKQLIADGCIKDSKMISVCRLMIKRQEQAIEKATK